jgi:hypothetical protein
MLPWCHILLGAWNAAEPLSALLLVKAMGLVVNAADRSDDVVGRLVVLEDPAQLGRGLAQALAFLPSLSID